MYVQECQRIACPSTTELGELPSLAVTLHFNHSVRRFGVEAVLKVIGAKLSAEQLVRQYRKVLSTPSLDDRSAIIKAARTVHGEEFIRELLLSKGEKEQQSIFAQDSECRLLLWRYAREIGREFAWQCLSHEDFMLAHCLATEQDPERWNEMWEVAETRIGKLVEAGILCTALVSGNSSLVNNLCEGDFPVDREVLKQGLQQAYSNTGSYSQDEYEQKKFVTDTESIITCLFPEDPEAAALIRARAFTILVNTELKSISLPLDRDEIADVAIRKVSLLWQGKDEALLTGAMRGNRCRLAVDLLSFGAYDYFYQTVLPIIRPENGADFRHAIMQACIPTVRQALPSHCSQAIRLLDFFAEPEFEHDDLFEIAAKNRAELLRVACRANGAEFVESLLNRIHEKYGADRLAALFQCSRMFMAYEAGGLEVVAVLKEFVDLTGNPNLKRQVILNFRHNTYIGDKSERRKWAAKRKSKARAAARQAMFLSRNELRGGFDRIVAIEAKDTEGQGIKAALRQNRSFQEALHDYPKFRLNEEFLYQVLDHLFVAVCLEGSGVQYDRDNKPCVFSEFSANLLQVGVFMATVFENLEQVDAFISRHIVNAGGLYNLAPPFCLPRSADWNPEVWRNLLMQDYQATRYLPHAADLQTYVRKNRVSMPSNTQQLEALMLAMYAADLDDVIIRYADVLNAANVISPYTLRSGFTFGIEQEFFAIRFATLATIKKICNSDFRFAHYNRESGSWVLKEDFGVSFGDNIWVGYETNTPIISPNNFLVSALQIWLINTMRIQVNSSCSLHVHLGIVNTLPESEHLPFLKQFALIYLALERDLSFLDHSLVNSYHDVFAACGLSYQAVVETILSTDTIDGLNFAMRPDAVGHSDPTQLTRMLSKLNFNSYFLHGTLEVRHHVGSNSFREIFAWLIFLDALALEAKNMLVSGAQPRMPDSEELCCLRVHVATFIKMRGGKQTLNDQALLPQFRDLGEGRFRKTDYAQQI